MISFTIMIVETKKCQGRALHALNSCSTKCHFKKMALVPQLLEHLHNASILCDKYRPCRASLNMNILTVCLPDVDDHGRLCQPFAAEWLRIGMPIYKAFGPQKNFSRHFTIFQCKKGNFLLGTCSGQLYSPWLLAASRALVDSIPLW